MLHVQLCVGCAGPFRMFSLASEPSRLATSLAECDVRSWACPPSQIQLAVYSSFCGGGLNFEGGGDCGGVWGDKYCEVMCEKVPG